MTINQAKNGSKLTVALEGRLDTTTAPQLEEVVHTALDGVTDLEFNFAQLEYVSSAGLRVLLAAQKIMNKQGSMIIHNASSNLMDIFEVTGFSDILTIE